MSDRPPWRHTTLPVLKPDADLVDIVDHIRDLEGVSHGILIRGIGSIPTARLMLALDHRKPTTILDVSDALYWLKENERAALWRVVFRRLIAPDAPPEPDDDELARRYIQGIEERTLLRFREDESWTHHELSEAVKAYRAKQEGDR